MASDHSKGKFPLKRIFSMKRRKKPGKDGESSRSSSSNEPDNDSNDIEADSVPERASATGSHTSKLVSEQCEKQKSHVYYKPIDVLNQTDLPPPYRECLEWSDLIKLKGHETVKISVSYTSTARPDGLGFQNFKGSTSVRYGSGTAFLCKNTADVTSCNCDQISGDHEVSGPFQVMTAAHQVYNDEEAKKTLVEFFYDSENSKSSEIVTAWGERVIQADTKGNRSIIECRTHDLSLVKRIQATRKKKEELEQRLKVLDEDQVKNGDMVFIISHPHGLSKHVSFGCLIEHEEVGEVVELSDGLRLVGCTMTYTAPTCPGSGGGSVSWVKGGEFMAFAPHCASRNKNENVSGLGWKRKV